MPGKHKIPSWQTKTYDRLVAAGDNWVLLGDIYADVENDMPLHHATRFQAQRGRQHEEASAETARWRYFLHTVSSMRVLWEHPRNRYLATQPSDRLKLRPEGACPYCGGRLYRDAWSRNSPRTNCAVCRRATRLSIAAEIAAPEEAPMPDEPPPHPLIGLIATRYDQSGKNRTRSATIEKIIDSHNSAVGDLAILALRDGTGIEVVPVCEFRDWVQWKLRPAQTTAEIDEEAAA